MAGTRLFRRKRWHFTYGAVALVALCAALSGVNAGRADAGDSVDSTAETRPVGRSFLPKSASDGESVKPSLGGTDTDSGTDDGSAGVPWTPMANNTGSGSKAGGPSDAGSGFTPEVPASNPLQALLLRISGSVSAAGSLFIIVSFGYFPESRKFSRKILVYMSIADFFSSGSFVWASFIHSPMDAPSTQCIVQGFTLQFFYLSSYLWTSCFAFHLFQLIWKKNPNSERYELYYHILSWGVPAALCAYFLVKHLMNEPSMGFAERPWCWIRNVKDDTTWSWTGSLEQFLFFYLPVTVSLVYNLLVYAFLARVVRQVLSVSMEMKIRKRLVMYLLVFLVCAAWGFANRIYQAAHGPHSSSDLLILLECVFNPLQGGLNALVYGMNEKLRDRYMSCCCGSSKRRDGKGARLLDGRPQSPSTDREQFYPHNDRYRSDSGASFGSKGSRGRRASEPNAVAM